MRTAFLFSGIFFLLTVFLFAQDKEAKFTLTFAEKDSLKICTATVVSDTAPAKGVDVHFYVKRFFSLLPFSKTVSTNDKGIAEVNFPYTDLPGDSAGNITVIAKIEDDDNYGTIETHADVKWGVPTVNEDGNWNERSLSASRMKAPMFLIISSLLIITVVWGTIVYVVVQIFRIKKNSFVIPFNKINPH